MRTATAFLLGLSACAGPNVVRAPAPTRVSSAPRPCVAAPPPEVRKMVPVAEPQFGDVATSDGETVVRAFVGAFTLESFLGFASDLQALQSWAAATYGSCKEGK